MNLIAFRRELIKHETDVEGGYVNDPLDLGKETNHGITVGLARRKDVLAELRKRFGWSGKMIDLTQEMAYFVYEYEFWHKMLLDKVYTLSPELAQTMFSWGLKSGSSRPVTRVQEIINVLNDRGKLYPNVVVDGGMGNQTLTGIKNAITKRKEGRLVIVAALNCSQLSYMIDISRDRKEEKNERFTYGWSLRCLREMADMLNRKGIPKI